MLEVRPIVVADGIVVGGNMRLLAMKDLGFREVTAIDVTDWTQGQRDEFMIKDNLNFGDWDYDMLANEWEGTDLADWGMDLWETEVEEMKGLTDEDDIPEPFEEPTTKLGDVWILGEHRVMCGDSTKTEDVAKLMQGERVDIAFTSPPYNAGQTPTEVKMNKTSKYENDSDNKTQAQYLKLLQDFTSLSLQYAEYSFVNIQSLSGNKVALIEYLYSMKNVYADTLIWNKQTAQPAMANNVLNSQYEYIHCFSEKANRSIGTKVFRGTLSNVVDISRQSKNKVKNHNATFPTEFAEHFVSNFTDNSVLDLFLGSGTTIIACEKTGRKCYGMELDPKYCDIIIKRWEEFTGKKAHLEEEDDLMIIAQAQ
tara:strand:- start:318 stop:1418 length:1101 start_codon:yes stop_codon:yes gene_type:complete